MGRKCREESTLGYYHVTQRGISKADIFLSDDDRKKFLKILSEQVVSELKLHCYCLMDNHIHLIVWTKSKEVLSGKMRILFERYAMYFNNTHDRDGPLYKDRFRSKPIETEEYFKRCVRYVLRNPIELGCKMFYDYKWSSIRCYFSKKNSIIKSSQISPSNKSLETVKIEDAVSTQEVRNCFNNSSAYFIAYLGRVQDDNEREKEYYFHAKDRDRRVRNNAGKDCSRIYNYVKDVYNIHDLRKLPYKERLALALAVQEKLFTIPKIRICECFDINKKTLRKYLISPFGDEGWRV